MGLTQKERDRLLNDLDNVGSNVISPGTQDKPRITDLNAFLYTLYYLGVYTLPEGQYPPIYTSSTYSSATEQAVKALQNTVGAKPDGIWGPNTYNATRAYIQGLPITESPLSQQITSAAQTDPTLRPEAREFINWFAMYNNLLVEDAINNLIRGFYKLLPPEYVKAFIEDFRKMTHEYIDECWEIANDPELSDSDRKERLNNAEKRYRNNVDAIIRKYVQEPILRRDASESKYLFLIGGSAFVLMPFISLALGGMTLPVALVATSVGAIGVGAVAGLSWLKARFLEPRGTKDLIKEQIDYIIDEAANRMGNTRYYPMLASSRIGSYEIIEGVLNENGIKDPHAKYYLATLLNPLIRSINPYLERIPPGDRPEVEAQIYSILRDYASQYVDIVTNEKIPVEEKNKAIEALNNRTNELMTAVLKPYEQKVKATFEDVFIKSVVPILFLGGVGAFIAAIPWSVPFLPHIFSGSTAAFLGMCATISTAGIKGAMDFIRASNKFIGNTFGAIGDLFRREHKILEQQKQPV